MSKIFLTMKSIKLIIAAVLVMAGMSVSAQWVTSGGNTTTNDFVGIDCLTNPLTSRPAVGFAVNSEVFLSSRVNCGNILRASTTDGKWSLGWGPLLGGNMEFYSSSHSSKAGQLNFTFGGAPNTGYIDFRQSAGDGSFISCFFVNNDGKVGIGTATPDYALTVNGIISADSIRINGGIKTKSVEVTLTGWPDYVFGDDYELISLKDVEEFINKNKHLPGIPSEKEVLSNGIELGNMNKLLLEKVEELTLYVIDLQKQVDELKGK